MFGFSHFQLTFMRSLLKSYSDIVCLFYFFKRYGENWTALCLLEKRRKIKTNKQKLASLLPLSVLSYDVM